MTELNLLDLNIGGKGVNDTIVTLNTVSSLVSVHKGYQDPIPVEVPGPPQFTVLSGELHQADLEAVNKDLLKMQIRDAKHVECLIALTIFGQYAVMKAIKYKDMSYIEGIGFEKAKKPGGNRKAKPEGPIGAPDHFTVGYGAISGTVIFKFGKVKGAAHYDVQVCYTDPNNEESWALAATFINTRHMQMGGYEPGKYCMFRVRCLGAAGYGPWTQVVKIMMI